MNQRLAVAHFAIRRVLNPLARQPFYVVLVAGNGQPVSRSVERFADKGNARGHAADLTAIMNGAENRLPIVDET